MNTHKLYSGWSKEVRRISMLALIGCASVGFTANAIPGQTTNRYASETTFMLNLEEASVYEVLNELERQSDFTFFYRANLFDNVKNRDVELSGLTIYNYLDNYLAPEGFSYTVKEKTVVIKKAEAPKPTAVQQQKTIKGTVTDEKGEPLPGVAVQIKGTTTGVVTDFDGNYNITKLRGTETLVFSFIGFASQEVAVANQTNINVKLKQNNIGLEEVIAVGYGVKKKSVVTGSISSLNSDELLKNKPANVNQALSGRAAGVVVSPGSGQPGSAPRVVIRGVGTNGNSSPLYIVDGLPMDDINAVNPNDIESMEVLKDATSAAIYGARAANGVILISTKKGKAGKTSINYDGFYGVQKSYNEPEMANSEQYIAMMKEYRDNDGEKYPDWLLALDPSVDTDWMDAITETAPVTEHNLSATFGSDMGSTLVSVGYRSQDGIIGGDNSYFKRYTARINTTQNIKPWLTVGANLNLIHSNSSTVSSGTNGWNAAGYAFLLDPTTPVYAGPGTDYPDYRHTDRGYGVTTTGGGRMWNPMHFLEVADANRRTRTDRFYGNAYIQIEPVKNLIIKSDFSSNISNVSKRKYTPAYYHRASEMKESNDISQDWKRTYLWQWENTMIYSKSFGEHNLSGLLGISASENGWDKMAGSRENLPTDEAESNPDWWYLDAGDVATVTNSGSAAPTHALASIFGRLSYDYQNKYMAEIVVRRDGSTNFGSENKYGVFPGVSLGWNICEEEFFSMNSFDALKLRASWGQNGNEAIDPFSYTSIIGNNYYYMTGAGSTIQTGSVPNNLVNPNVMWETSEQLDIGVDFTLYGGKLRGSIDYYNKETKDLLLKPTIEDIRGNKAPYQNLGIMSNKGLEFQLGYTTNIGDLKLGFDANAAYLKNEVLEVGNSNGFVDGVQWRTNAEYTTRMEEGMPIGYFYGYKTKGIFQTEADVTAHSYADGTLIQPNAKPGDLIFQDTDGKDGITTADRVALGNPWPKWTVGLNLSAEYKGFDFSAFVTAKFDVDVMACHYRSELYGTANLPTFYTKAWKQPGDKTNIPRLTVTDANGNFQKPSDLFVYDASFVKIGNIEVGFSLPKSVLNEIGLSKCRFYVAMDNVATFTDYPFFDPEIGTVGNNNILSTGLDKAIYPQAQTSRIGVSIGF